MSFAMDEIKNCYQQKENSFLLSILIQPNCKKNEIQGIHSGKIKMRIHSPPIEGRANEELILYLAEVFHLKRNQIEIVKGHLTRHKQVKICPNDAQKFEQDLHHTLLQK
jgi:uncharacterized protein (TIGR00251 family)